jgi:hypothetical protein
MKRKLAIVVLAVLVLVSGSDARFRNRSRSTPPSSLPQGLVDLPCDPDIEQIEDCPVRGCSDHEIDPLLNERKNISTSNATPAFKLYSYLRNLPDPSDAYEEGGNRDELTALGEGQMITVIAYAVRVSKGSSESCNCGLTRMRDKDNHIVLIDPNDRSPSLADEPRSQTAEFTPRVRLDHPNFKWSKLNNLIQGAGRKALKVRVTGLQMFDSHHFFNNPLPRTNNWEIHPVFALEYCPRRKRCVVGSDANWVDLDQ